MMREIPRRPAAPIRMAIISAALATGGCTSTQAIAPHALPALTESTARYPRGWHETTAPDGRPLTLRGAVVGATIERADGVREEFNAPLRAAVVGDEMHVSGDDSAQRYALSSVRAVEIDFTNERRKHTIGGIVLVGLGAPFLIGGVALAAAGFTDRRGIGVGAFLGLMGVITAVQGVGLTAPGIWLLAKENKDPRAGARRAPALIVGPGRAALSGRF